MHPLRQLALVVALPAMLLALCQGCTTVNDTRGARTREVDPGQAGLLIGTGPESQDVVAIADKMMRSLLASPTIANATKPPTVALIELRNKSRFPINSDIFLHKLRVTLNSKAGGKLIFLAREDMEAIQKERAAKREGDVTSDAGRQQKAVAGADYFLTGTLDGLAKAGAGAREDYLLYTFRLTDTESSIIVWEDEFETKRVGRDDAVYR